MSTKTYTSDEIHVFFHADRCIHAAECVKRLPEVFDTKKRPWVNPAQGKADAIAETIHACPSGALTYERKDGKENEQPPDQTTIDTQTDGPYFLHGALKIETEDGVIDCTRAALCSCGQSGNKPFCDNSHKE